MAAPPARRSMRLGAWLAAAVAVILLWGPLHPAVVAAGAVTNTVVRGVQRDAVLRQLAGWPHLQLAPITVYYAPGSGQDAQIVAAAAKAYYPRVLSDYGLAPDTPAVIVVVSPDQMAHFAGTGSSDPPLGAYDEGVVWLLAPSAFMSAGPDLAAQYAASGPVAHELTHLANDLVSGGQTPAWLDEGLAQYEDWRLTGYVWTQPDNNFSAGAYSWTQLTQQFYGLSNVALAYRQALAATAEICRTGPGACVGVLRDLRAGMSPDQALTAVIGPSALTALESGAAWRPGLEPEPGAAAGPQP